MSWFGVRTKPYRTKQQSELEYLEKQNNYNDQYYGEVPIGIPIGQKERNKKQQQEQEFQDILATSHKRSPIVKTKEKLELKDFL